MTGRSTISGWRSRLQNREGPGLRRALFLLPSDRMGGAERVVRTIALEAARCGQFDHVEIFVLCWSRTGTLDELEALGKVRLHYTEARNERGGLPQLIRFLMRHRYAFVFSSSTHLNALCSLMRKLRLLRTERLVSRESTVIFDRDFGLAGHLFRAFYKIYGSQDLIVCQTQRMYTSLDHHTNGKFRHLLRVLPNPIDFDRIEAGHRASPPPDLEAIPSDRIKIVWCGRLSPIKSPVRAIETLRTLHDKGFSNAHLVVVGDGPERASVERTVERLTLGQFVTLVGQQDNPAATMARCDLGLLTSDTEGFPNVILEMLATGIRGVVTTDCAGDLTSIPGVRVSASKSAAALAEEIAILLEGGSCDDRVPNFLEMRRPSSFLTKAMI